MWSSVKYGEFTKLTVSVYWDFFRMVNEFQIKNKAHLFHDFRNSEFQKNWIEIALSILWKGYGFYIILISYIQSVS